ncbi:MAG: hypothetical protein V3T00_02680 [bacterium]
MKDIFLGKPLHWGLWFLLVAVLYVLGGQHFHVRHFGAFILLLLAIAAGIVLFFALTYRKGAAFTRESIEEADGGTSDGGAADDGPSDEGAATAPPGKG